LIKGVEPVIRSRPADLAQDASARLTTAPRRLDSMTASNVSPSRVAWRIAAGMLGGYAFTWGFIALAIGLLFAARMEFHDAEALGYIVGFIVFLVAFLWAFSAHSLARVWLVLAGGGALMAGAAWLVQRTLL
jgi:hypothetical protein